MVHWKIRHTKEDRKDKSLLSNESFSSEFFSPIATARRIVQHYHAATPPFDLNRLCNDAGIKVETLCMDELERIANLTISSVLYNHPKHGWSILINEEKSDLQVRYAIAHELGHYFLHARSKGERLIVSFDGDRRVHELQADKFANELLMSEDMLREAHGKMVIPVCSSLAKMFGVPEYIMMNRLEKLDLIAI